MFPVCTQSLITIKGKSLVIGFVLPDVVKIVDKEEWAVLVELPKSGRCRVNIDAASMARVFGDGVGAVVGKISLLRGAQREYGLLTHEDRSALGLDILKEMVGILSQDIT